MVANAICRDIPPVPVMATDTTLFLREKHISYWLRCLRSPLPQPYTTTDSTRMTLAFFIISALDLLGALFERTTSTEREEYIQWIYSCQVGSGGFRGFPGTDFGERSSEANKKWDPANVPATYFALSTLSILGDDLSRVKRRDCLSWLRSMQRGDGSFGELLGPNNNIEGGTDTRFADCAMCIRWILRGHGDVECAPDIDIEALLQRIRSLQTYDGGIAEAPLYESHAGFTYCAVAALSLLDRLPREATRSRNDSVQSKIQHQSGLSSYGLMVNWLVSRLTVYIEEDLSDEDEDDSVLSVSSADDYDKPSSINEAIDTHTGFETTQQENTREFPKSPIVQDPDPPWTGFNGRCNKVADTCYAFWVGAALNMLSAANMVALAPTRRYLLDKTQHRIAGGFGKFPGNPPDVYHSYLALAALSLMQDDQISSEHPATQSLEASRNEEKINVSHAERHGPYHAAEPVVEAVGRAANVPLLELDPALCFSKRAKKWIESLPWKTS